MPSEVQINPCWPSLHRPGAWNFETKRLGSFDNWERPDNCNTSALTLAKDGFYSTGKGDELQCYHCNGRLSDWDRGEDIRTIHRNIFPDCPLAHPERVHERNVLPNIPIPNSQVTTAAPAAAAAGNAREDSNVVRGTEETGQDADIPLRAHPLENQFGLRLRDTSARRGHMRARRLIPREPDGSLAFTARLEPGGGVLMQSALYGEFSSAVRRTSTFGGFPIVRGQLIQELIRHGFFYVGHDDIVLCYSCGLAVNNWQPQDDPKMVHSLWRPGCQHVRYVQSNTFIQRMQRSVEVIGHAC